MSEPFAFQTVVHLVQPWGEPAFDFAALARGIADAPDAVLFRHVVQGALRHPAAAELPPDDFSAWAADAMQSPETAERLSYATQVRHDDPATLREALLAALESAPPVRAHEGAGFTFLATVPLCVPTGLVAATPDELFETLASADAATWFLHLVEEPWLAGHAPLLEWLVAQEARPLAELLRDAAHSGLPIDAARALARRRWRRRQLGRRLAEANTRPEGARREAGRSAVARLVRRARGDSAS